MLHIQKQFHESWANHEVVRKVRKLKPAFIALVIVPTFLSIIYFGFLASDVYVAESYFVVRTPKKEVSTGLSALFSSAGHPSAGDEIYVVEEFMNSRDALAGLNRDGFLTQAYTRDFIDSFDRFRGVMSDGSKEELFRYYKKHISASYDTAKAVTVLRVKAYTPEDAYRLNARLLDLGEQLVNKLNERSRNDLVRYAEREVEEAKRQAAQAAAALSRYRNNRGVVDPERQATVQIQLISKLQDELIANETQLEQLQQFTPDNPQVAVARERVRSIRRQIQEETGKIAGNASSLAGTAVGYERVSIENEFAGKQMAAAMASLQDAKNEARRQQIYLERIVQPNKPDKAVEPKRIKGILATLALGLVFYAVFSMLIAGIREHRQ
jgi:capsular polysaccharide transport system permease protein